jgi:hypothetical protein
MSFATRQDVSVAQVPTGQVPSYTTDGKQYRSRARFGERRRGRHNHGKQGNNTTMAECDIFGTVPVSGLNTVLVSDRFAGVDTVSGGNLTYSQNVRFDDANGNHVVDASELGGSVTCGS